jgi:hypothetical protein
MHLTARLPAAHRASIRQGPARLGMHRWDAGFGDSENDPYHGGGVGYQFNERFNMSLNFDRYAIDTLDSNRISLGSEVGF